MKIRLINPFSSSLLDSITIRSALYINMVGMMLLISCACLCGVALYAVYGDCDPLKLGLITSSDQLMPYFVMDHLKDYPGVPGLFVACVFSASLSTLSSGFNALATVTWDDFLKHSRLGNCSDLQIKLILKIVSVVYGVLSVAMAFTVGLIGSVLNVSANSLQSNLKWEWNNLILFSSFPGSDRPQYPWPEPCSGPCLVCFFWEFWSPSPIPL